jgi:hypothetical protein
MLCECRVTVPYYQVGTIPPGGRVGPNCMGAVVDRYDAAAVRRPDWT